MSSGLVKRKTGATMAAAAMAKKNESGDEKSDEDRWEQVNGLVAAATAILLTTDFSCLFVFLISSWFWKEILGLLWFILVQFLKLLTSTGLV